MTKKAIQYQFMNLKNLKCLIGKHPWDGCKCTACGKPLDNNHDWSDNCNQCRICGYVPSYRISVPHKKESYFQVVIPRVRLEFERGSSESTWPVVFKGCMNSAVSALDRLSSFKGMSLKLSVPYSYFVKHYCYSVTDPDSPRFGDNCSENEEGSGDLTFDALSLAACSGKIKMLQVLLAANSDVNVKDGFGATALHHAAIAGQESVVKFLLTRGAEVNTAMTINGATALHLAAIKGHYRVVKLLVQSGAEAKAKGQGPGRWEYECIWIHDPDHLMPKVFGTPLQCAKKFHVRTWLFILLTARAPKSVSRGQTIGIP